MPISNDTRVNSALRLAGGYTISALTAIAVLGFIPQESATALIQAIRDFNDGIQQAVGALGKMWIIAGPLLLGILAKFGIQGNSLPAIIDKLLNVARQPAETPEAAQVQQAIIQATAAVATAPVPLAHNAKVVLLDAVAAQPEVVGTIKVTDPKLEADTTSQQIKAA